MDIAMAAASSVPHRESVSAMTLDEPRLNTTLKSNPINLLAH
jgi:hypothetical protein